MGRPGIPNVDGALRGKDQWADPGAAPRGARSAAERECAADRMCAAGGLLVKEARRSGRNSMRDALIVWGGWSGHEPERCAAIVGDMLEQEGFAVRVESTTEAFGDSRLADMSLVVPIVTASKIEKHQLENLSKAVRSGVGLGGFHGGMC